MQFYEGENMKGEEKKLIFNFLKAVSSQTYGYSSPDFKDSDFNSFEDDFVEVVKTKNLTSKPEEFSQEQGSKSDEVVGENKISSFVQGTSEISEENLQRQEKLKSILENAIKNQIKENVPLEKNAQNSFAKEFQVGAGGSSVGNIATGQVTTGSFSTGVDEKSDAEQRKILSLENLSKKVNVCTNCILSKTRKNTVFGEGNLNPLVMVIGEGPGEEEDLSGRPFVGKAGQLLDKMLAAISLDRNVNCYIANIVKCRPPRNRTPMEDEAESCKGFLQAQINTLKPKYILAMGRTAVQNLLETSDGINALRGKWFSYNSIPLMATFHPSALLHDNSLKVPAWEDLKLFRKRLIDENKGYDEEFRRKKFN